MTARVGIVLVSHSAKLAEAALALALEMVQADPPTIVLAAGTADGGVGTDAVRVAEAITEADHGAGVVVIMDLGSAVLSAELALEFVGTAVAVRLVDAPFVEGLLAAAVRSAGGASLDEVADEARAALAPKTSHLTPSAGASIAPAAARPDVEAPATVRNEAGIHARPAAQLAALAATFTASVTLSTGGQQVDARSPLALATLNARSGALLTVGASGPDADAAVAAIVGLVEAGFGEPLAAVPPQPVEPPPARALGVSPGRAVGVAVVLGPRPDVPVAADVPEGERPRAAAAIASACADVAEGYEQRATRARGQGADVLRATAAIAKDPAIGGAATALVNGGLDPARAVWDAVAQIADTYRAAGGVLAARVTDLEDVRDRVIARLRGEPEPGIPASSEPFVLIARDLAPADTALLDPGTCRAIVTELGSPTSHTAILARELGIPAVVGVANATQLAPGTQVLVDGQTGEVILDPSDAERAGVAAARVWSPLEAPGHTKDLVPISLLANVGAPADAAPAASWGAEGVGLFRTEFCFLDRVDEPTVAEQVEAYRAVLRAFPERRVVVRTLDAGSDKPMPFLTPASEPNPALGVRGYRTTLLHPDVLARQLEAIAAAAAAEHADAWVMAPMISTIEEAQAFVRSARGAGLATAGVMVETPSAALMAAELCAAVDFLSLGTNDLAQYTMGADRLSATLAPLSDPWQPAVLRLIASVADAGRASGTPVGVCGESAGRPDYAPILVGLGVTSLSMSARSVPAVGAALSALDFARCSDAAKAAVGSPTARAAREAASAALN